MKEISLKVNGEEYELEVNPSWTLLKVLREKLGLKGTKLGCEQGECGACTVLVDGEPVLSCLTPIMRVEESKITTIEGVGKDEELHPVQEAFIEEGALQCGFCTPGFILTVKSFLEDNPNPSEEEIRKAISGNICRCTGYETIVDAVESAAVKMR